MGYNNVMQPPLDYYPQPPNPLTSDERVLGGLSHLFGLFVALIIWLTQKDKSRFVRFQAGQAMAFDLTVMVVMFVLMGIIFGCMLLAIAVGMGGMLVAAQSNSEAGGIMAILLSLFSTFLPFGFFFLILPISLTLFVFRLIAALKAFQGENYHYPWLGNRVEKFLA
jgi:uncharacterized Tic20 family protein